MTVFGTTSLRIIIKQTSDHHHRRGRRFFLFSNIFRHSSARAKLINSIPTLTTSVADILKTSETNWAIEKCQHFSFHRSLSLRMNHLRCTSRVNKCKFGLSLILLVPEGPFRACKEIDWPYLIEAGEKVKSFCAVYRLFIDYQLDAPIIIYS